MECFNLCTWIISLTPLLTLFPPIRPITGGVAESTAHKPTNFRWKLQSESVACHPVMETCQVSEAASYAQYSKIDMDWCGTTRIIINHSSCILLPCLCSLGQHVSEHHCHCLQFSPIAIPCPHLRSWGLPGLWAGAHNISDSLRELHTWFYKTRVMLVAHCCRFNGRASVHGTAPNVFVFGVNISSAPTYIIF